MKRYLNYLIFRFSFAILLLVMFFSVSSKADIYTWGVERIGADIVHYSGNTGSGIKIAIIDTGIDYTHPELADNYAGGYDYVNGDDYPMDDNGHGTQVAGIIGAADNDQGIVGVAPDASLYAYKVFDAEGKGTYDNIIKAIYQAIADDVDIINMSLGSLGDPGLDLLDACKEAAAEGILLVAGAGNTEASNIFFPAAYSSVIAVGSTTKQDERADFSNTGPELELMAPGVEIYTTDLYLNGTNDKPYIYYGLGTSFSSAYVTGAAALYMSAGIVNVREMMISTAIDLGAPGFDTLYGYGLVNVEAAVVPTPSAFVIAILGFGTVFMLRKSNLWHAL